MPNAPAAAAATGLPVSTGSRRAFNTAAVAVAASLPGCMVAPAAASRSRRQRPIACDIARRGSAPALCGLPRLQCAGMRSSSRASRPCRKAQSSENSAPRSTHAMTAIRPLATRSIRSRPRRQPALPPCPVSSWRGTMSMRSPSVSRCGSCATPCRHGAIMSAAGIMASPIVPPVLSEPWRCHHRRGPPPLPRLHWRRRPPLPPCLH